MTVWNGSRVTEAREAAGLTGAALTERLREAGWRRISRQHLAALEAGRNCPSLERAAILASVLGLRVEELLTEE